MKDTKYLINEVEIGDILYYKKTYEEIDNDIYVGEVIGLKTCDLIAGGYKHCYYCRTSIIVDSDKLRCCYIAGDGTCRIVKVEKNKIKEMIKEMEIKKEEFEI